LHACREQILEIGFGSEHCILALAQAVGESGKVYGIDIAEGMQTITRKRIEQAGLSADVELCLGDTTEMEFDAGSLDCVLISFTLELFDTPKIPGILT
jgi:demethylmenaquinone methyltransferase/2-methoxy-6-polyprenyl-1,4-benzoquinol methylase